ncbi:MAG: HEAT repeat domain-containing protein [Candidatus Riflebacteria bacterium]|nr:HEAT repeat domain-containing protein [Candidatus Riflebacteria bacterium]
MGAKALQIRTCDPKSRALAPEVKFGAASERLVPKIQAIEDMTRLQAVARAIKSGANLDDVERSLGGPAFRRASNSTARSHPSSTSNQGDRVTTEQLRVDRLIEQLDSTDEVARKKTLFQLGKILDSRAIPAIKHVAAEDSSPEVKYLARKLLALYEAKKPECRALIRPGSAEDDPLTQTPEAALRAADPSRRAAALRACAQKRDAKLIPAVLARTGSDEKGNPRKPVPEVRSMIPVVLAQLGGKEQVDNVAAFLQDKDPRVKSNAIAALQAIGDQASWARIIRCVQDPDHRVRTAAIAALAKLGKVNLIRCCQAMIEGAGAKYWEKDSAVHLLASAGLPDAIPLLESVLTDSTPGVARKALKGLETLAAKGCEPAKRAVETAAMLGIGAERPDEFLQLEATASSAKNAGAPSLQQGVGRGVAVAAYGADGALPILIEQIRTETNVPLLVGMLRTLGQLGNPLAIPLLKEYLAHEVEEARGACVEALRGLGTDEALNSVIPALRDRSPVVVGRAIVALKAHPYVDPSRAIAELAGHADVAHRRTAVLVVGELAEERFASVIETLGQDRDPGVAQAARDVLTRLRPHPAPTAVQPVPASKARGAPEPPASDSAPLSPSVAAERPAGPASAAVAAAPPPVGAPTAQPPIPATPPASSTGPQGAGRIVKCPRCKETVAAPESPGAVRFQCPGCDSTLLMSKFHVTPQLLMARPQETEPVSKEPEKLVPATGRLDRRGRPGSVPVVQDAQRTVRQVLREVRWPDPGDLPRVQVRPRAGRALLPRLRRGSERKAAGRGEFCAGSVQGHAATGHRARRIRSVHAHFGVPALADGRCLEPHGDGSPPAVATARGALRGGDGCRDHSLAGRTPVGLRDRLRGIRGGRSRGNDSGGHQTRALAIDGSRPGVRRTSPRGGGWLGHLPGGLGRLRDRLDRRSRLDHAG